MKDGGTTWVWQAEMGLLGNVWEEDILVTVPLVILAVRKMFNNPKYGCIHLFEK